MGTGSTALSGGLAGQYPVYLSLCPRQSGFRVGPHDGEWEHRMVRWASWSIFVHLSLFPRQSGFRVGSHDGDWEHCNVR